MTKHLKVLLSSDEIAERVAELGSEITRDFKDQEVHVIGVLKGSFVFLADLVRHIETDVSVDFLGLSSYGNSEETSGVVRMTSDLSVPIKDKHVLIVEDIIDSGLTMKYLLENLRTRLPQSLSVCTLLYKPGNLRVDVPIEYIGFKIPNDFVVGYGLDYAELYRNIPYIGVVTDDDGDE